MKTTREMKRKGFTLVELLIVIVVIGVLSAMMMLSSTEAVSSARASDIVSDLRNLKTAALAWYADNLDYVEGSAKKNNADFAQLSNERADIFKYMGSGTDKTEYTFSDGKDAGKWFVWCKVTDSKVKEKLKSRKSSTGLWGATSGTAVTSADYEAQDYVGMFIR